MAKARVFKRKRPVYSYKRPPLFEELRPLDAMDKPPDARAALHAILRHADLIGYTPEGQAFLLITVSPGVMEFLETFDAENVDDEWDFYDENIQGTWATKGDQAEHVKPINPFTAAPLRAPR